MTERPTRPTTNFTAGAALCLTLGGALLTSSVPARAEDDGVPIDTKILRSIMSGLGLKRDGDVGINYQERAPLVLPPSSTLPPPENSSAAITRNPAWPKDPEIATRKAAAEREREAGRDSSNRVEAEARPLRPDQLVVPGSNPRADKQHNPVTNSATIGDRLNPAELGTKKGLLSGIFSKDEEQTVKFTGERTRTTLTEPPPGYQTPSPDQPYGVGGKAPPPKAFDYETDRATVKN
jgi:hypothetical protein